MYLSSFDDFAGAAQSMFEADPLNTRCLVKFRHVDGFVDIKVTNDKECLKFRTDQQQDLKRFEKLSKVLFRVMADVAPDFQEPEVAESAPATASAVSPHATASHTGSGSSSSSKKKARNK